MRFLEIFTVPVSEKSSERSESGFSFIELLTVISTIAILSGISLATFFHLRTRAFDAEAKHDLKNAIIAQEALYAEESEYVACVNTADCEAQLPGFHASGNVVVSFDSPDPATFVGIASHPAGGSTFQFDNLIGMIQEL
jgi:Tfp pilus assembly protein PilE